MKLFVLRHPQSANLFDAGHLPDWVHCTSVACGTSKVDDADLSEAADFTPNYSSWNSCVFEGSVIMTVWEHADRIVGDDDVAFLHSDVELNKLHPGVWDRVRGLLHEDRSRSIGLTAPAAMRGVWRDVDVPEWAMLTPVSDPMMSHQFEFGVSVWDFIKKLDPEMYIWAMTVRPAMIYAHQFACSRRTLDGLGAYLFSIAGKMPLGDVGLWTPHVFERLIGMWLVRHGGPAVHTTSYWHYQSSGCAGDGLTLYGPKPVRYYKSRNAHRAK